MKGLTDWQHTTYTLRAMYGEPWYQDTDDHEAAWAAIRDAIDARSGMGRGDR